MRIFHFLAVSALALQLSSCAQDKPKSGVVEKPVTGVSQHETDPHESMPAIKPADQQNTFEAYNDLKNALAFDDLGKARSEARDITLTMSNVDKGSLQHPDKWDGVVNEVNKHVTAIDQAANIAEQRKHFEELSGTMEKLITEVGMPHPKMYKQECPMAFPDRKNETATWLSIEQNILNPYRGAEMRNCGSVIATIN